MALENSDYDQLSHVLEIFSSVRNPAEAHGTLCGVLGFTGDSGKARWIAWLLEDAEPNVPQAREGLSFLDQFYDRAMDNLCDESWGFQLLLPAEECALSERIRAMAEWCDGFVFGLGFGGVMQEIEQDSEVSELVKDMIEISKIDGAGAVGEGDESDLVEIVEYVRIGVLNLLEMVRELDLSKRPGEQELH